MASSRRSTYRLGGAASAGGRAALTCVLLVALTCVLACALALCAPARALAASSLSEREVQPVSIESVSFFCLGQSPQMETLEAGAADAATGAEAAGEDVVTLPRFSPVVLSAACSPESIEAGIDCGMDWMCGIEPCLCGSSDAWGGCSCNGTQTVRPTVSYTSSDESVVRVVEWGGKQVLVPQSPGSATITCTSELHYFESGTYSFTASLQDGVSAPDVLLALVAVLALVVAAAVVCAIAIALRAVVRVIRRKKAGEGHEAC